MSLNIKKIPYSKPSLGRKEISAVKRVLKSGWITSGKENLLFEDEFADFTHSPYALSVNSATAGLHLLLEALGIKAGDRVATPAYSFTASAEIISYLGAVPVFIDCEDDYNISASALEKVCENYGDQLKAVIVVHIAGKACDMKKLLELKKKFGFSLIEDCAHAFPVVTNMGHVGTLSDGGVFSFYANKTITTGEGGMVICRDKSLYQRMSLMRLHGIDRTIWDRYTGTAKWDSWKYDVVAPGYKYNLTNFQAAIGRVQLKKSVKLKNKRRDIAHKYLKNLSPCKNIQMPYSTDNHCWHLFMIKVKTTQLRDSLMKFLFEHSIGTSLHFIPLPCLSFYRKTFDLDIHDFPISLDLYQRSISLPIFPDMTNSMIQRVIKSIIHWDRNHE
ncbi:MAG: DegT/DnrJ/EryC1/StrS family aminotransferase [Spirochaetaceae bacterium]|jgi:dTDP-4-amino-4,6-dideoxygalactose transaminase|nr:DegT/DnrJ/EryC1/StrS family aminotransferase [Spirochaetaceae bacterium]